MGKVVKTDKLNNPSKYKVLFISSWYPTRVHEFNGDFVKRHAKAVSKFNKVTCLYVIYDESMDTHYELVENSENDFFETIIYFNTSFNLLFFRKWMKLVYYFKGLNLIIRKQGKPDIVHANILVPVGFIAWLFYVFYKIPFVITEHWTGFLNGTYMQKPWIYRFLYNKIAGKSKTIMPVSQNLLLNMNSCGIKGNFVVIPNVVDTSLFKYNLSLSFKTKQILHISDLNDDHKNVSGLLRAIERLGQHRQDFILNVVHNHENPVIFNYARELGIEHKFVSFLGKKEHIQVAEIMANSAFLVLFSNYENLPCVIVEALASGIPVLSTNVGGISEYINDEYGILIDKGKEDELFDKMNFLLDHYSDYDKEKLHDFAATHFSSEAIGKKYIEVYDSVIYV